jgi:hypothetical protein
MRQFPETFIKGVKVMCECRTTLEVKRCADSLGNICYRNRLTIQLIVFIDEMMHFSLELLNLVIVPAFTAG